MTNLLSYLYQLSPVDTCLNVGCACFLSVLWLFATKRTISIVWSRFTHFGASLNSTAMKLVSKLPTWSNLPGVAYSSSLALIKIVVIIGIAEALNYMTYLYSPFISTVYCPLSFQFFYDFFRNQLIVSGFTSLYDSDYTTGYKFIHGALETTFGPIEPNGDLYKNHGEYLERKRICKELMKGVSHSSHFPYRGFEIFSLSKPGPYVPFYKLYNWPTKKLGFIISCIEYNKNL